MITYETASDCDTSPANGHLSSPVEAAVFTDGRHCELKGERESGTADAEELLTGDPLEKNR